MGGNAEVCDGSKPSKLEALTSVAFVYRGPALSCMLTSEGP